MKKFIYLLPVILSLATFGQVKVPKDAVISVFNVIRPTDPVDTTGPVTGTEIGSDFTHGPYVSTVSTSAGVYLNGIKIRNLWDAIVYSPGSHDSSWDGRDDLGNIVPKADYQIRVISGNLNATWMGVIGNTSTASTGESVHRAWITNEDMCFAGRWQYITNGYSEGNVTFVKTLIGSPNSSKQLIRIGGKNGTGLSGSWLATDGKKVYCAGSDSRGRDYKSLASFTFAIDTSEASNQIIFSSGVSRMIGFGGSALIYISAINLIATDINGMADAQIDHEDSLIQISGMDVQGSGNLLFIAHIWRNELRVLNKNTGQLLQSLTIDKPRALAVDTSGNLWLTRGNGTITKYAFNSNGTINSVLLDLATFTNPLAMSVSSDNTTLAVCEGSTSQIKAIDNFTGAAAWTYGDAGGYSSSSTVSNTKFYWRDLRGLYPTFIAYQPDGSFWVADGGNSRSQHFAANRTYIERIMQMGKIYSSSIDANDSSRVVFNFCEFKIDYSKALAPDNGSWELTHNWGYNITPANFSSYQQLRSITTLPNGRTYALSDTTDGQRVVELMPGGNLRSTGIKVSNSVRIRVDGNLYETLPKVNPQTLTRRILTGYDGTNPYWGPAKNIVVSIPNIASDPLYPGDPNKLAAGQITTSGVYVTANQENTVGGYWHLGGWKDGKWIWKVMPPTFRDYDGDFPVGSFDIGNKVKYAGVWPLVAGDYIFFLYHGEFWKNGQTTKCHVYTKDGLLVGVFGVVRDEVPGYAPYAMAGNCFSPSIVKLGNKVYLYLNDESHHSGGHMWLIQDFEFVEQIINTSSPSRQKKRSNFFDLHEGLVRQKTIENGAFGWTRHPETETSTFTAPLGYKSYTSTVDVFGTISDVKNSVTNYIRRTLPDTTVSSSWTLWGNLLLEGFHTFGTSGTFFEVLDDDGKTLVRINDSTNSYSGPGFWVKGNGANIVAGLFDSLAYKTRRSVAFSVKVSGGMATIKYGGWAAITVPVLDGSWDKPRTVQLRFVRGSSGGLRARSMGVDKLKIKYD